MIRIMLAMRKSQLAEPRTLSGGPGQSHRKHKNTQVSPGQWKASHDHNYHDDDVHTQGDDGCDVFQSVPLLFGVKQCIGNNRTYPKQISKKGPLLMLHGICFLMVFTNVGKPGYQQLGNTRMYICSCVCEYAFVYVYRISMFMCVYCVHTLYNIRLQIYIYICIYSSIWICAW